MKARILQSVVSHQDRAHPIFRQQSNLFVNSTPPLGWRVFSTRCYVLHRYMFPPYRGVRCALGNIITLWTPNHSYSLYYDFLLFSRLRRPIPSVRALALPNRKRMDPTPASGTNFDQVRSAIYPMPRTVTGFGRYYWIVRRNFTTV